MIALPGGDERAGVFGSSTLLELPSIVRDMGLNRLMLITGNASFRASGAADVLPELRAVAAVEIWSDFSPNPHVDEVIRGVEAAQAFQPDAIVAIGGGSVLDMAKLLAVFMDNRPGEIRTAVRDNNVTDRAVKLILAPTTSGSGSEATHFAVVYLDGEKFSVAHQALLPDFVILDPDLSESASTYQKATSVIDAIAQAVESHWARGATVASRAFAQDALTALVPSAAAFVSGDRAASALAARGSHLAGRAIDISKTTGAHALAYGLTQGYGVSHGHAVATTLGAFGRLHAVARPTTPEEDELQQDLDSIAELIGAAGAHQVGERLDQIAMQLGLELRLRSLGVAWEELAGMAATVNRQRMANNPVEVNQAEVLAILEECW